MTKLTFAALSLLLALVSLAWGQDILGEAHTRIDAIRQQKTVELDAEDAACLSRFAVTDCQSKVRTRRRQMLADLKRQEGALKAVERQQKGLEQLKKSDDKAAQSAQRDLDAKVDTQKKTEEDRQKSLDGKVLSHRDQAKATASQPREGKSTSTLDAATAEKNRMAYEDKLKALDKRRQERDKRLQDHGPGSSPLPASP